MNNWFLTMLTLWRLGYLDGDDPDEDDDIDDAFEGDDDLDCDRAGDDSDDDVPPWFKPPYWPP